jgi:hypothetical protein
MKKQLIWQKYYQHSFVSMNQKRIHKKNIGKKKRDKKLKDVLKSKAKGILLKSKS